MTVNGSDVTAGDGSGRLLRVSDTVFTDGSSVATSRIDFSADASTLRGDVVVDSATADVRMVLGNGTTFSGALRNNSGYQVAQLALDGSSQWNVRASSSVGALEHAGTIAFDAPGQAASRPSLSAATMWATVVSGSSTVHWVTTLRWATSWSSVATAAALPA